jgi:hypothetical protein
MSKRAERRHHLRRMKAKAEKSFRFTVGFDEAHPKWAHKFANHLASCSCWMCGNPRKWFKEKTIQEIKADMKLRDV